MAETSKLSDPEFIYLFIFGHRACRMLLSQPGIEPIPSAIKSWSLHYWTDREVQHFVLLTKRHLFLFLQNYHTISKIRLLSPNYLSKLQALTTCPLLVASIAFTSPVPGPLRKAHMESQHLWSEITVTYFLQFLDLGTFILTHSAHVTSIISAVIKDYHSKCSLAILPKCPSRHAIQLCLKL